MRRRCCIVLARFYGVRFLFFRLNGKIVNILNTKQKFSANLKLLDRLSCGSKCASEEADYVLNEALAMLLESRLDYSTAVWLKFANLQWRLKIGE